MMPRLRAWAGERLRGHLDADEIVQKTLIRATTTATPCRDDGALQGWVWAIAKNILRDYIRGRTRTHWGTAVGVDAIHQAASALAPIDAHEQQDECRRAMDVIKTLSLAQQQALYAHLGLVPHKKQTPAMRDVALCRARAALRQALARRDLRAR